MRKFADDPRPWAVLASEHLFRKPPWLTVRQESVRLPSGNLIPEYWVHDYPPWVNVIALTRDQRVVLVRQYRHGVRQVHFELPAGTIDEADASLEIAARRELLEETGYGGGRWSFFMTLSANPALTSNLIHTWLAEDVEAVAPPSPEATEDLRVHPVSRQEVRKIIDDGEMLQALHVAPLARYLLSTS